MIIENILVAVYRTVHGGLHLRGAGYLLGKSARFLPGLQNYPLKVAGFGEVNVDFRDSSAFMLINFELGDETPERGLLSFLEKRLNTGAVLWDVGANIGEIPAFILREKIPFREIQAFEPNPRVNRPLGQLLRAFPRVMVNAVGLGEFPGTGRMDAGAGESTLKKVLDSGAEGIPVEITSGDELVYGRNYAPPSLIKIDVEGFEARVLAGMKRMIAEFKPVIVFEHLFLQEEEISAMIPPGYELKYLHDRTGVLMEKGEIKSDSHNAVLLPRSG